MFRTIQIVLTVATLIAMPAATQATPITWDILNQNYGNGSGQVSFLASYDASWSTDPTETLADGMATLTLPPGAGAKYQTVTTIAGMVTGNADYTLEFKARTPAKSRVYFYLSETNSTLTSSWNHIFLINGTFTAGYQADALQDYNKRNGVSDAPLGFDGSLDHVYRIVRESGVAKLYLDNNPTPIIDPIISDAGAALDSMNLIWGFPEPSSQSDVNFSYLKIASGAHAPVPEPATLVLLVTGLIGLLAYAWRKRK